jgi:hypothetical protein
MALLDDGPTLLGSCIRRVVHRDNTLTNIIITPTCITACNEYVIEGDDDVDKLFCDMIGSIEWFNLFGFTIGILPNLTQLTFDGLDTDVRELETFWGEISNSTSLTTLKYVNMNLEGFDKLEMSPNIRSIICLQCTISKDILEYLDVEEPPCGLTALRFDECRINAFGGIFEFNATLNMQVPT